MDAKDKCAQRDASVQMAIDPTAGTTTARTRKAKPAKQQKRKKKNDPLEDIKKAKRTRVDKEITAESQRKNMLNTKLEAIGVGPNGLAGALVAKAKQSKSKVNPLPMIDDAQRAIVNTICTKTHNGYTNAFITGSGGTGKTYVLHEIVAELRRQNRPIILCAPTGIAAAPLSSKHIIATTIHSAFGLDISYKKTPQAIVADKLRKSQFIKRKKGASKMPFEVLKYTRTTPVIIIDEISMLNLRNYWYIDQICRIARNEPDKPFGGIQILHFGDFFQLPPIRRPDDVVCWKCNQPVFNDDGERCGMVACINPACTHNGHKWDPHNSLFAFQSTPFDVNVWEDAMIKPFHLTKVYRQGGDLEFIKILEEIRHGRCTPKICDFLTQLDRPLKLPPGIKPTMLYPHNAGVACANAREYNKLDPHSPEHVYNAIDSSTSKKGYLLAKLQNSTLIPSELKLKIGAQVMLLANVDISNGFSNGATGLVVDFVDTKDPDACIKYSSFIHEHTPLGATTVFPVVSFTIRGNVVTKIISPHVTKREDEYETATRLQVPLTLAWAVSIHKSQGMSIPYVHINCRNTFAQGQLYVALSRAMTLAGLWLVGFEASMIMADQRVIDWTKTQLKL